MKYKVGDKVRIRKDLISGTWFRDCLVTRDMCEMGGKEAVIKMVRSRSYLLSTKGTDWSWTDEMLEPVPDDVPDDVIESLVSATFEEPDNVNQPPHYNKFTFQPIDIIAEVTNYYEGSSAFHIGTVLKYLCRAPFKGKLLEDLKKANYYLTRAIEEMEEEQ